jgi:peptidoglycan/LPS O-acetylase OafA/YrhL
MSSKVPGYGGVAPHYSGTQILAHFLYFIPLTDHDWLSPVYWSLAYEFVFYIFAALTFPFFAKRDPLATLVCAAFIVALKKTIAGNLDHRIFEFAFGVILARLTTETILSRNILAASLSLFFIFLTGGSLVALVLLVTGSAIYGLRKVEFGYLAFAIGGISYSLYLTHTTVGGRIINLGKRFSDGPTQELSLLVVALTVSLLFAFLYSKAIENPAIIIAHRIKTTRFK